MLAGLLGRAARLLPGRRREWAEAALNESGQVPAGARRAVWLGGGLWLVTREALIRGGWRMIAFAAGAAAFVWFSWPGPSSNSALLLNRAWMAGTLLILAVLPLVIRRQLGPVRGGWVARAVRVGGYALILVMIAAKAVKDRDGSELGQYFAMNSNLWIMQVMLFVVIAAYVAGLLILTSQGVRLTRWGLPAIVALRAEYKHEISVGQAGQTLFAFLLVAPIIGLFVGSVAATIACGGVPREDPASARPGRGDDVRRATATGDA